MSTIMTPPNPPIFRPLNIRPISEDPRRIVRCIDCNLIQFETRNGFCRRCNVILLIKAEPKSKPDPKQLTQLMGERLSKWIVRQLKERNMDQSRLASKAGLSNSVVSLLIRKNCLPTMETIFRLANAVEMSAVDLWRELEG